MKRSPISSLLLAAALALPAAATAKTLKIATLAPPDSAWMRLFEGMNAEIKKATGGAVVLRYYPGGASGDEKDMVRKLRIGQLHGGALSSVGLGEIQPEVLVLQMPLLFRNYDELDHVRTKLSARFDALLEEKGYINLGWGDVGYTYVFSNVPVRTLDDLKKVKMWNWVDDPIGRKVFELAGINPVPLAVPDVLPSLQTGLIDGCYASPLVAIAMQWHTKVKYVATMPLVIGIGATVLSKKEFDAIPAEHQAKVREIALRWHAKLVRQIRDDNRKAVGTLKKAGIQTINIGAAEQKQWQEMSARTRAALSGKLFSAELLAEVEKELAAYRSGGK